MSEICITYLKKNSFAIYIVQKIFAYILIKKKINLLEVIF